MNRHSSVALVGLLLFAAACHDTSDSNTADGGGTIEDKTQLDASDEQPAAQARDRSVTITRGAGHTPHEVELDPRGQAALTIDALGSVCLWPAIRTRDPATAAPYTLPVQEPLWMSLAQADDGSFVVALIDTTNAGQVVAVTPKHDDTHEAKLTPLFAIPPDDPLLELHALDGGQRVLALGVDHRVRLYDRSGALLSVIDERSFGPWQLRVVQATPGEPPKIAAILAQPVRVQSLELRDDRLSIVSEPRAVVLDRGPNRNDLLMSPDGRTVAALRRPRARGREFSIELIDLITDQRRLVAGKTDSKIRARMHFVDAERILLESGSPSGRGVWVELAKAELLADPADADPDSKLAERLYKTSFDMISVPASAERKPEYYEAEFDPPWDQGVRFHASVVAGVRVNIERLEGAGHTSLIVDPLDSDRHLLISHGYGDGSDAPVRGALDHAGTRLAIAGSSTLRVTNLEDGTSVLDETKHGASGILQLAFADPNRLLLVDDKGRLKLFELPSGAVVAATKLDFTWSIGGIVYRASESGGVLAWRSGRPRDPERLLEIRDGQLGAATELARAERPLWLEILDLSDAEAGTLFGMTEDQADTSVDEYTSTRDGRLIYTERSARPPMWIHAGAEKTRLRLPAGQARELSVSPDGSKIAVVQFRSRDDDIGGFRSRGGSSDFLLSVLDLASGERLWTWGSHMSIAMPSWSGDGQRLLAGAQVRDANTGEPINTAITPTLGAGVSIEERGDAEYARYRDGYE
jgi:hypothetical protein